MPLRLLHRTEARSGSTGRPCCLIINDTNLSKTGWKTKLIDRIYSHGQHQSILGSKGLLCHTDGKPQAMFDFSLHGEGGRDPEKAQDRQGSNGKPGSIRPASGHTGKASLNAPSKGEACHQEWHTVRWWTAGSLAPAGKSGYSSASTSLNLIQYNILSHLKRFEAYKNLGGLFRQTVNGAIELPVTKRVWKLVLQMVAVSSDALSADEEGIIRLSAWSNPKFARMEELYSLKNGMTPPAKLELKSLL